jgi:hypothetical protein
VIVRLIVLLVAAVAVWVLLTRFARRSARRAVHQHRARVDRFKLTRKRYVIDQVLADPAVHDAVRAHAKEHGQSEELTWQRVRGYLDEIVPFFNVLAYYRFGYGLSRVLLRMFYKVSVEYARPDPFKGLPRDSIVVYLMNHRSNAISRRGVRARGDVSILTPSANGPARSRSNTSSRASGRISSGDAIASRCITPCCAPTCN